MIILCNDLAAFKLDVLNNQLEGSEEKNQREQIDGHAVNMDKTKFRPHYNPSFVYYLFGE